jgi:branched-chain amino acid aminotransferase
MAVFDQIYDIAFFEGEFIPFSEAKVSIGTHALQYGTGAFAGVRGYLTDDKQTINIFRLRDHAARLLRSAKLLRMQLPHTVDSVAEILQEVIRRNEPEGDVYFRPFIYKASVQLTPRLKGLRDELAVYMMPMGNYLDITRGQKVHVSSWTRIDDNTIPSRAKITGGYINSSFAKDEAEEKGADEAIMLTHDGKVAEGSAANLFMVRDGVLITPPINGDILEGITRRTIIELAGTMNIPVEQRAMDRSELYLADELFFSGTGAQVAPIESVDGRPIGEPGVWPITRQLGECFFDIVRGRNSAYSHWLTPVALRQPASTR